MKKVAFPSYPLRGVHLVTVWAYAVSQPVFSLLEANPEFLVVRGSTRTEVVLFALVLVFVPPLLALGCQLTVRLVSARLADVLHLVFLGAFVVPLAFQVLKIIDASRVAAILGAAAIALLAVQVYARFRAAGLFLTFSLVLPLAGLFSFVLGIPLATDDAARAKLKITATTPVVLLVLDEFPASSLLASDGRIDSRRYPNFARLARSGTWYSRATTVHEHTTHAVPAILDGKLPRPGALPTLTDHPENLFTLLGESYETRAVEPITHLCPRRYCESRNRGSLTRRMSDLFSDVRVAYLHRILPTSLAHSLPAIDDRWGGFGDGGSDTEARDLILGASTTSQVDRIVEFEDAPGRDLEIFLSSIQRGEPKRTLHFLHLLLPHSPWHLFPSGREYGNAAVIDGIVRDSWNRWEQDPWLVQQGYQRHLLQVGYTDRVLGRILDRLAWAGLYDDALVAVVADQGVSFVPGGTRRTVSVENLADVARVPMLIKLPRQRSGRTDERAARTIDLLPTIADALDVRLPWKVDGRSLLATWSGPRTVAVGQRDGAFVEAPASDVDRGMNRTVHRKFTVFGEGSDSLFEIGSHKQLLGLPVSQLSARSSTTSRARFDGEELLGDVRTASAFIPARITGFIEGQEVPLGVELAVAVNGRIAALTRCFRLDGKQRFSALVPEAAFRNGFNRVALFEIEDGKAASRLTKIGESGEARRYELAADGMSITLPDGRSVVVENGRISGRVETWMVDSGTVRMRGWAADLDAGSLPDRILLFASGRLLYAGETTVFRWDLDQTHGRVGIERAGWVFELPTRALRSKNVRVFAIRDAIASELPRPAGFPWA